MAFKKVQDLDCDVTTALGGLNKKTNKPNPTQVEGYYIGNRDVPSKKARSGFAKLYIFQTENGNLGVWGKTDLDRKMISVKPGEMTRVTQSGKLATPNGEMYKFTVEVDAYNTISVDIPSNQAPAAEGAYDNTDYADAAPAEDEPAPDEVVYTPPSKPARAASTPDAARQAKVKALLEGNRTKN